jgi:2-polyprenyl-3-methyl-5-hydroxy-6-metoxy-1,4-benzoquinol methylase
MSEQYRVSVDPAADNNPHSYAIRFVGSGHRVLEVGCSVGHVTEHLVAAGNTVVGVEIDPDAAEHARRFAERVHVLDLDVTPLSKVESDRFDVILLGDVLEHLRNPSGVLRDLTSLLEPDGRLVVSVPHVGHIDVRLMLLQGRWAYQDDGLLDRTHLRWFTRQSLREMLAEAGFVATAVERVRFGPWSSGLPIDPAGVTPELVAYIEADPEAHTFQFVVEAQRTGDDVLTDHSATSWPQLVSGAEMDELRSYLIDLRRHDEGLQHHVAALETELDAWRNSRLARWSAAPRSVWGRLHDRLQGGR